MRQFDVFPNPSARSREVAPFVAIISSHFVDRMATVLVAPMVRMPPAERLSKVMVEVAFSGETLMLSLPELAPIPRGLLGHLAGDLRAYEDEIRRALDRLFTGF